MRAPAVSIEPRGVLKIKGKGGMHIGVPGQRVVEKLRKSKTQPEQPPRGGGTERSDDGNASSISTPRVPGFAK